MITLSEREHLVAEQYCKGLADKEVADSLQRSEWTIKAQKRDIYKKLGISKDTELVLYMFCERMKINFDIKEIRKNTGLSYSSPSCSLSLPHWIFIPT